MKLIDDTSLLGYKVTQVTRTKPRKSRLTSEQIEKFRKKAIRTSSKSSKMFLDLIELHFNIKFEREFELQNKFFDARYKDIIIEVDSDYWHKSKRQKANDNRKNDIAIRNGYKIYRFKVNNINYSQRVFEVNKEFIKKMLNE